MPISFQCSCGKRLRAADESAGKAGVCPRCGASVIVPAPQAPAPLPQEAPFGFAPSAGPAEPAPSDALGSQLASSSERESLPDLGGAAGAEALPSLTATPGAPEEAAPQLDLKPAAEPPSPAASTTAEPPADAEPAPAAAPPEPETPPEPPPAAAPPEPETPPEPAAPSAPPDTAPAAAEIPMAVPLPVAPAPPPDPWAQFAERILTLLRSNVPQNGLFAEPDIPPEKLANARARCGVPPFERILGMIDCTVFGSAENCLLFGTRRIYYHNDLGGQNPGPGSIPYEEFPARPFVLGQGSDIDLCFGQSLNVAVCPVPAERVLGILEGIRQLAGAPPRPPQELFARRVVAPPPGVPEHVRDPEVFQGKVLRLLAGCMPQQDLFVAPHIPAGKLSNAAAKCEVPPGERILGLVDCTVFGSAKNSLLIGSRGIYYHNDWSGKTPGTGFISYDEFSSRAFTDGGFQEVSLGLNQFVSTAGSNVPKATVVSILASIQQMVGVVPPPAPPIAAGTVAALPPGLPAQAAPSLEERILELIKRYLPQDGLSVAPQIPDKKLANAVAKCELPPAERVLGLIDCTVFGSAKNCLLFGAEGIYFHNDWSGKSPGRGFIPYEEFAGRVFMGGGFQEVSLGLNQFLNTSGSSVPKATVVSLLESIKQMAGGGAPAPTQLPYPGAFAAAPAPVAPAPPASLAEGILNAIRSGFPQDDLFAEPNIPAKKLANAQR